MEKLICYHVIKDCIVMHTHRGQTKVACNINTDILKTTLLMVFSCLFFFFSRGNSTYFEYKAYRVALADLPSF